MWKRLEAEGVHWEARATGADPETVAPNEEVLEFRALDNVRPPRRIVVSTGALEDMDEEALRLAFTQARPIGADFYGRPGKRMTDVTGQ